MTTQSPDQSATPRTDAIPRRGPFHHYLVEDVFKLCRELERELNALSQSPAPSKEMEELAQIYAEKCLKANVRWRDLGGVMKNIILEALYVAQDQAQTALAAELSKEREGGKPLYAINAETGEVALVDSTGVDTSAQDATDRQIETLKRELAEARRQIVGEEHSPESMAQEVENGRQWNQLLELENKNLREVASNDEDTLDLMVDEFERIKNLTDNQEIIGLCERAVSGITQTVPLIEQRDTLQKQLLALSLAYQRQKEALRFCNDSGRIYAENGKWTIDQWTAHQQITMQALAETPDVSILERVVKHLQLLDMMFGECDLNTHQDGTINPMEMWRLSNELLSTLQPDHQK